MRHLGWLFAAVLLSSGWARAPVAAGGGPPEPAGETPAASGQPASTAFVTVQHEQPAAQPASTGAAATGTPPPPALLPASFQPENLTSFDYRLSELRWHGDHWQLAAGQVLLKDFGPREADAREALRIVRELRLTQHGTIGTPRPIMEYWLADGQAPLAFDSRLRRIAFDPHELRVDQLQGQWCLRDATRVLFNFGAHADDARQALDVVQRHGFSQVGFVGQPVPVLIYFLGGTASATGSSLPARTAFAPRTIKLPDSALPLSGKLAPMHQPAVGPSSGGIVPASFPTTRQLATPNPLQPDAAELGDRVPFDWRQVQVRQEKDHWKVAFGDYTLADFGPSEREARQALSVLQYYHFTEQCLVGRAPAAFSYYLASGQAPRGALIGIRSVEFRPEHVTVERVAGAYVLTDGSRLLVNFGDHEKEAKQLVRLIQQHKFDRLCRVGSAEPAPMTFFTRVR